MKIMLINGSPKGEGSDTLHMTCAFLDGMGEVAENEIQTLDVMQAHIEFCRGCLVCMRNGGHCVIDDDMAGILRDMLQSDLLLFSFPLYGFGVPAPLKALLDRTLPLGSIVMRKDGERYVHEAQMDSDHLRFLVISGCGFPNTKGNFEALRLQMRLRFDEDVFMLTVSEAPLFNIPDAKPVTEPFLALVRKAGREYAEKGSVSEELMARLAVPMIPEATYAEMCNATA